MGRINSSVGIASGFPIQDTVDKLIKFEGRSRDALVERTTLLDQQRTAITDLTAKLLAVQFSIRRLAEPTLFKHVNVTSSNAAALTASATDTTSGVAPRGTFRFTPVRQAQAQQVLSSGFADTTDPIGAGTFSFRVGGAVDQGIDLAQLNAGRGVERGKIRITDRSGANADIDLRFVRTVDDVLDAINANGTVDVTAEAHGDSIRLTDHTGLDVANLRVQEIGGGKTAADLGIALVNVAANTADGADILQITDATRLDRLNDGRGVRFDDALPDLEVTFRDGSSAFVDFHRLPSPAGRAQAVTPAAAGVDAQLIFTAKNLGDDDDGVTIRFVDDGSVTQGHETVTYVDSDPNHKRLVFGIAVGATTANDILAAFNNAPAARDRFTAGLAAGSSGAGVVDVADVTVTAGGAPRDGNTEATLGEVIATLNAAAPGKLRAEIAPDGDRIVLTDLTADAGGTFAVTPFLSSSATVDLGLGGTSVNGTLSGQRLFGGLKTKLLSGLDGGKGITLGLLSLTDRSGTQATVDLASARTLEDVIDAVNAAAIGIDARVNDARNGIVLDDTTGSIAGNLIVANGDATTQTADALQLATDAPANRRDGGSLHWQVVGRATRLDSLNGGAGVARGRIRVFDSLGASNSLDLARQGIETVGDVIDAINGLGGVQITARINDHGDGIALVDEAHGNGSVRVQDINSTTARDLHLAGVGTPVTVNGTATSVLDGSTTIHITINAGDNLEDLIGRINVAGAGVTASLVNDGAGLTPFHFTLANQRSGSAAALLFDTSQVSFSIRETARGEDALLVLGDPNRPDGVLASSRDNTFSDLIHGLRIDVHQSSTDPVTLTVSPSDASIVERVQAFVNAHNTLRAKLAEATAINSETFQTGVLYGTNETFQIGSGFSRLLRSVQPGDGPVRRIEELGISIRTDGSLAFDAATLQAEFAGRPDAVARYFSATDAGLAPRFDKLIESLVGKEKSVLVTRAQTLVDKITINANRIGAMNARLERRRQKLLNDFYRMDAAISKIQKNLSSLNTLQSLADSIVSQGNGSR